MNLILLLPALRAVPSDAGAGQRSALAPEWAEVRERERSSKYARLRLTVLREPAEMSSRASTTIRAATTIPNVYASARATVLIMR